MKILRLVCTLLIISGSALLAPAQDKAPQEKPTTAETADLPGKAAHILDNYCFRCHRGEGSSAGRYAFNARNVVSMADASMVVEGDPENSQLLDAVFKGRMPPKNQSGLPRPSAEEIAVLREWIQDGAKEFPKPNRRPFMSLSSVMQRIAAHNQSLDSRVRNDVRYFTLANLYNDPSTDDRHLRMTRAALAKAINSLSWQSGLVIPQPIDPEETIYAVDISKLGWTREHWLALISEYPYEVDFDSIDSSASNNDTAKLRQIESDMSRLNGGDKLLRHVRADWFITMGLRPNLYHKLLYDLTLPDVKQRHEDIKSPTNPKRMTDLDLENFLRVAVEKNIFGSPVKAMRSGYNESGVSGQNRMVERHDLGTSRGYYWKSYDFLASNSRSILSSFPLGPLRNRQDQFAFIHDGGEILYTLPNGLQGYLLVTGKGDRIDAGPIEVVGDALKTSGNQLIVNGLSCIVCHRRGIIEPPDDQIRKAALAYGEIADRIRDLYPEAEPMRKQVEADTENFTRVAYKLMEPFLLAGEDKKADIDSLPEPVGEVARKYLLEPMNLETVASELYIEDTQTMKVLAKRDARVRLIGLGQLKEENGTIKRDAWQNRQGRSLMQQAATVFGYGQ